MTYGEAYRTGIQILKNAGIEAPANDAGVLLCHAAKCDRTYLYAHGDASLGQGVELLYHELLEKRVNGWPLQYLTGVQEFMSLQFQVGPGVLIPRQDTELLVETVLDYCKRSGQNLNILDMCTGSGCIAVSIAYHYPGCLVTAADVMPDALDIASGNAERNGVSHRISFIESNLFSNIPKTEFDVIVSNPPYIRSGDIPALQTEVRDHEPIKALDGGSDGLCFYRSIIDTSPMYLKIGGLLAFEVGYDQASEVAALMAGSGRYHDIRIHKDLAGIDRVVSGSHR